MYSFPACGPLELISNSSSNHHGSVLAFVGGDDKDVEIKEAPNSHQCPDLLATPLPVGAYNVGAFVFVARQSSPGLVVMQIST